MSIALATKGIIAPKGNISIEIVNLNLPLISHLNNVRSIEAKVTVSEMMEAGIEIPSFSAKMYCMQTFNAEVSAVNLKGVKNA